MKLIPLTLFLDCLHRLKAAISTGSADADLEFEYDSSRHHLMQNAISAFPLSAHCSRLL